MSAHNIDIASVATMRAREIFDVQCQESLRLNCKFYIMSRNTYAGPLSRHVLLPEISAAAFLAMQTADTDQSGFRRLCDVADTRVYVHRVTEYHNLSCMPLVTITKSAHDARRVTGDDELDIFAFTLKAILAGMNDSLVHQDPGPEFAERDAASFLRWAASRLMIRASLAAGGFAFEFFDEINNIALSPYEGESAQGLLLVRDGREHACTVNFSRPIPLRDRRRARKLITACSTEFSAVTNGGEIFGYDDSPNAGVGFRIRFHGRQDWSLMLDGKRLLRVVRALPELPRAGGRAAELRAKLEEVFGERAMVDCDRLQWLVDAVSNAMHGSVVVVFGTRDDCMREVERLGAMQVEAFDLNERAVKHITRIDGALLVDGDAKCYAIGAILDGTAVHDKEDPARGSRYNSAMRYAIGRKRSMVVVTSEDGGVDLLP